MSVVERVLRRHESGGGPGGRFAIGPMRRRDLRLGVLEIERRAYPTPWSPSIFESEIDQVRDGSRYYVVARDLERGAGRRRGAVVGYAGLWFAVDEAHVTNVAVHPDRRREGIATELLLHLATTAVARGMRAWTLEVRLSSTGAQELYRGFGFAPAGLRTRYYENTEDAIVMWCHGIQEPDYADRLARLRTRHREGR